MPFFYQKINLYRNIVYNVFMQLKEYLKVEKHTQNSFINLIEMATGNKIPQSTLAKWITGVRIPRKNDMIILYKITDGAVQPNDFYEIKNES